MSSILGKIRTETRSAIIFLICVISGKPDQIARPLGPTIEQNVQFQVGVCHEKTVLDQIQNGRPVATFDFNMHNNWKTVPDS